jgi:hypothetical protein
MHGSAKRTMPPLLGTLKTSIERPHSVTPPTRCWSSRLNGARASTPSSDCTKSLGRSSGSEASKTQHVSNATS